MYIDRIQNGPSWGSDFCSKNGQKHWYLQCFVTVMGLKPICWNKNHSPMIMAGKNFRYTKIKQSFQYDFLSCYIVTHQLCIVTHENSFTLLQYVYFVCHIPLVILNMFFWCVCTFCSTCNLFC